MPTILIVDDEAGILDFLQALLSANGFAVVVSADGSAVAKIVQSRSIDLVLCDLFMPNKDGLETIKALRSRFPDLPIIAMSGGATRLPATSLLQVAVSLGAIRTLHKPFSGTELLAAIEEVLPKKSS